MRQLILLAVAVLTVAGCNTVSGVGRDVQAAGKAVAGAAEDVRR